MKKIFYILLSMAIALFVCTLILYGTYRISLWINHGSPNKASVETRPKEILPENYEPTGARIAPSFTYETGSGDEAFTFSTDTSGYLTISVSASTERVVASGACVDKARAVLTILKRRYPAYEHRIGVLIGRSAWAGHCQVVRTDIDGSYDYLKLTSDFDVVVDESEFNSDSELIYMSPQEFIAATDFYCPEIDIPQVQLYLSATQVSWRDEEQ